MKPLDRHYLAAVMDLALANFNAGKLSLINVALILTACGDYNGMLFAREHMNFTPEQDAQWLEFVSNLGQTICSWMPADMQPGNYPKEQLFPSEDVTTMIGAPKGSLLN